jgi:hypothetical protein
MINLNRALLFFIFHALTINSSYSKEKIEQDHATTTWSFYSVSKKTLVFSSDNGIRKNIDDKYSSIIISLSDKHLSVGNICSVTSVKNKRTVLDLWLSKSTVELYRKSLRNENILLPNEIYSIAALFPQDDCPAPFNELYEINNSLIAATSEGYLLIFRESDSKEASIKSAVVAKQDNFMKKYKGDVLVSDKSFVKKINETCLTGDVLEQTPEQATAERNKCVLSKINFKYDRLTNMGKVYPSSELDRNEKLYLIKNSDVNIYIDKTKNETNGSHYSYNFTLVTEKESHPEDKMTLYIEDNDGEALLETIQYYYIDENFNIWLMLVTTDESGTKLKYWKKYNIDDKSAKFNLVDEVNCEKKASLGKEYAEYCK